MAVRSFRNARPSRLGTDRHKSRSSPRRVPAWVVVVKPLFIAAFTLMFFLLVFSMAHHGFFSGGPSTYPSRTTRPYAP